MKSRFHRLAALCFAVGTLALAACSGNFASGTAAPGGVTPPMNGQQQLPGQPTPSPTPTAAPKIPPGASVTYAFADAPKGLQCPESSGFTCIVVFNLPTPPPSPKPGESASPSPSPSPTPTPTPTPTPSPTPSGSPSGSPSPSQSPKPSGPRVTLEIEAMTKNAPPMHDPNPKSVGTIPLVVLRVQTDHDEMITGGAAIIFTIPKEQLGGRGFALQLFEESPVKKKFVDHFIAAYNQSTVTKNGKLAFKFTVPPLSVKANERWLIVLYGDDKPATPAPSTAPSASASSSASPLPTPSASSSP